MAEPGPPDAAGQRRAALLTTLAVAANVGAGAEGEVVDPQPGKFRQAQAGLDGEEEQRVVAATESGGRVWRCEERVDFGGGEEGDEVTVEALLRDGEDALDQSRVRWLAAGREAEERVDRREPRVACPDAVAALLLEVIEEGALPMCFSAKPRSSRNASR